MKYTVDYDDLYGHVGIIDTFKTLEEAQEFFKAECYTPASETDDFIVLELRDDDDDWVDTIDDYQFTRLDKNE